MTDTPESGDSVQVASGQPFAIELASTPTTGYTWEVEGLPEFLELRDMDFDPKPNAQVGDGGVQRFHLVAHRPGCYRVQLILRRPWESEVADRRSFQVSVQ